MLLAFMVVVLVIRVPKSAIPTSVDIPAPIRPAGFTEARNAGTDRHDGDALRTILELEEEGVVPTRARIAESLDQSGPTVSQTVARMERHGLVHGYQALAVLVQRRN
jgi:hypothetical protein